MSIRDDDERSGARFTRVLSAVLLGRDVLHSREVDEMTATTKKEGLENRERNIDNNWGCRSPS
jgi:hypothetical protein